LAARGPRRPFGFGNTSHHAIRAGVTVLADILNKLADPEQRPPAR
jgi:hypothetical protein